MNTYCCFWSHSTEEVVVDSDTTFNAQLAAAKEFQKKTRRRVKTYDVTVVLAAKDGVPVVHQPQDILP